MKLIDINGEINMGFEVTIGGKRKNRTAKEQQIENLRWKLRFHQEQASRLIQQIKDLEGE